MRRLSLRTQDPSRELMPMRWLPTATLVLLVILGGGALAIWLLDAWAAHHVKGLTSSEAATLRLDAIKTALTVAAALGAGVTLLVTLRRQSVSERAQRFVEEDARRRQQFTEEDARRRQEFAEENARQQRITTLYVAAVEQLGNEKAAVRLGGLYALDRLGQDNPPLRQTVVDVICAYLRMPYTPPAEIVRHNASDPPRPAEDDEEPDVKQEADRRQELQVRLTAQRLLRDHTRPGDGEREVVSYWRSDTGRRMDLDLTGSILINFELNSCHTGNIRLTNSHFRGDAHLGEAQFHGHAYLDRVQFHEDAHLDKVQFHGRAELRKAQFHGRAVLGKAQFHRNADLISVQFHGNADLGEAQFHGDTHLLWAKFHGVADLRGAQFHGEADLRKAQFDRTVSLREAQFHGRADFQEAQFNEHADLIKAQFHRDADLREARFDRVADLREAQFHRVAYLSKALFLQPDRLNLTDATISGLQNLPHGWQAVQRGASAVYIIKPIARKGQ